MRPRVLLTGASGFIGGHVLDALLARGQAVRILTRRLTSLPGELLGQLEVQSGDLRSPAVLRAALADVDTVLHLAGCAKAWSPDPTEFHQVNVVAVARLLAAAEAAGVRRLVHVSTVLTHPGLRGGRPPDRMLTEYERTKAAGEALATQWSGRLEVVVVQPTRVYGPGPLNDANGVTRLVSLALRGPAVVRLADGDVRANYVHVEDVATGIRLAASAGRPGERYVLGGENASVHELLARVAAVSGRRCPVIAVPPRLVLALARCAGPARRLGLSLPITPEWVRVFLEDHTIDSDPTWRALGHRPRPLEVGLKETITWLRQRRSTTRRGSRPAAMQPA